MLLIDRERLRENVSSFLEAFPGVTMNYAVKCNNHIEILKYLIEQRANFDCASVGEISLVSSLMTREFGMSEAEAGARIIYANTHRFAGDVSRAYHEYGVRVYTVDSEGEILKFRGFRDIQVLIRLQSCEPHHEEVNLSEKFGCGEHEAARLLALCNREGMDVAGFCFHLGYPCGAPMLFDKMLAEIDRLATAFGVRVRIIDIGGGFVSRCVDTWAYTIDQYRSVYDRFVELEGRYGPIRLFAEPGRYIVEDVMTLVFGVDKIAGHHIHLHQSIMLWFYRYIFYGNTVKCFMLDSDGIGRLLLNRCQLPTRETSGVREEDFLLVGGSGLQRDCIMGRCHYNHKLSTADGVYLVFFNAGSYTYSCVCDQLKRFCGAEDNIEEILLT